MSFDPQPGNASRDEPELTLEKLDRKVTELSDLVQMIIEEAANAPEGESVPGFANRIIEKLTDFSSVAGRKAALQDMNAEASEEG